MPALGAMPKPMPEKSRRRNLETLCPWHQSQQKEVEQTREPPTVKQAPKRDKDPPENPPLEQGKEENHGEAAAVFELQKKTEGPRSEYHKNDADDQRAAVPCL